MKARSLLVGVLCALTCLTLSISTEGKTKEVKVAYFDMGDYYQTQDDGTVKSYDTEFLGQISEETGLSFVYVDCGTWRGALKALKEHKVDLLGTVQKNQARLGQYEFTEAEYGITCATLACLPEKNYNYEDYDSFQKSTIGCVYDYVRKDELEELFKDHKISPTMKYYKSEAELFEALEQGEIDLIAANSHTLKSSWKIVEKYAYAPFFFATYEGNKELTNQISEAIISLQMDDAELEPELLQEYFPVLSRASLTKDEYNLVQQDKVYKVYFESDTKPLSYLDSDTGELKGALVDICKMIAKQTGIQVEFEPIADSTQYDKLHSQKDTITFTMTKKAGKTKEMSDCFVNLNFYLYGYKNREFDNSNEKSYRIAVPKDRSSFSEYFAQSYPNYQLIEYDTPLQCFDAMEAGQVDYIFLQHYVGNSILTEQDIDDIALIPMTEKKLGISLDVGSQNDERLLGIINKGIQYINQDDIQRCMIQNSIEISPTVDFDYMVKNKPKMIIGIITAILLIIMVIIIAIVRYRLIRKQKAELAVSNAKLERANLVALNASKAKTDFLSRMSHDMRTPMNVIIGLSKLGFDDVESPEKMTDCLEKINHSSEFLLGLINDILDMSKIENDAITLKKEPYDINEFIDQLKLLIGQTCQDKGVQFCIDNSQVDKQYIIVDKLRFNQIFYNLLSNASKFTQKGGRIDFVMKQDVLDEMNLQITVTVRDTGRGMSQEFLKHLFEPFAQENVIQQRQNSGTGLGLSIVNKLVEIMGGTISVKSELGKGSSFVIVLPVQYVEQYEEKDNRIKECDTVTLQGRHILLCEDHDLNRQIARRVLEKEGIEVVEAVNGEEGVQIFTNSNPNYFDVILMDIRMPVMDGLTTTKEIRKLPREDAATIPIIAMTANAYDEDVDKSMQAGMNAHLSKPIVPETVYKTLKQYID